MPSPAFRFSLRNEGCWNRPEPRIMSTVKAQAGTIENLPLQNDRVDLSRVTDMLRRIAIDDHHIRQPARLQAAPLLISLHDEGGIERRHPNGLERRESRLHQ